ncbi:glycosyltransferase [Paenimyroides tangerinum]|uniref:Glycosyltransferase n=1 Tax=Paenimyroides tangerinum TaxID=2488728 RepID=A0A3P3WEG5_9FLAO|nr:glycosyltransferase [Paenimyroides tangerinum]RRJ92039.1 glycosyltransferase [Paenimyroides tangerinum]
MNYSFIIPVYNRPDEIDELLESLITQNFNQSFEVVVVEDGSTITCKHIIEKYTNKLDISYFFKPNSGPGDSRNFGMKHAKGDYFIILDSDCIIPSQYLSEVDKCLATEFVDCFGGPDAALDSFSDIQKAINITMTSFMTTGGIRGGSEKLSKFQPRSFNMGISKKAFVASNGFGKIHPGEDPDLTIRLWKLGFETRLFPEAFVYHKRRIDWKKFYTQVNKFGKARPILNQRYPEFTKITYWFPTLFLVYIVISVFLLLINIKTLFFIGVLYFVLLFFQAVYKEHKIKIGFLTIISTLIQFYGYGIGFLISSFKLKVLKQKPEIAMPEMFFK